MLSLAGTWSIASIMTGDAIDSIVDGEETGITPTSSPEGVGQEDDTAIRVQVAIALCLLVGIIQVRTI